MVMTSRRSFAIRHCLALLLLWPGSIAAQSPDSLSIALQRARVAQWHLRITTSTAVWEGRIVSLDDTTVVVGRSVVPKPTVTLLERRRIRDRSLVPRVLIGGAVGALVSRGVMEFCCDASTAEIRSTVLVSAGISVIVGLLVGGQREVEWDSLWSGT